jgi:DNA invertase Pin-like site-specific DNA recombinase
VVEILPEYSRVARHYLPAVDALRRAHASTTHRPELGSCSTPVKASRRALDLRLGPDQLDAIVARYKAGETTTALAREYAISHSSILRLFSQRGMQTRVRGLTPEKEREVLRLRAQGLIIREVAKRVGCSYDTVRLFLLNQKNA